MIYSTHELRTLARAYGSGTNTSFSAMGLRIFNNPHFFRRFVDEEKGINSASMERLADWFLENWPDDLPWPSDVERKW